MKNFRNYFLTAMFLILSGCSQAGWMGYYEIKKPAVYNNQHQSNFNVYFVYLYPNSVTIPNKKGLGFSLPKDCSSFRLAGFFTPITPPIPLFWFRNFSGGDCDDFTVYSNSADKIALRISDKTYDSLNHDGSNYQYTFPVKAKSIDSGTIIIEKDGEKIEVPFEYKYFKFWY